MKIGSKLVPLTGTRHCASRCNDDRGGRDLICNVLFPIYITQSSWRPKLTSHSNTAITTRTATQELKVTAATSPTTIFAQLRPCQITPVSSFDIQIHYASNGPTGPNPCPPPSNRLSLPGLCLAQIKYYTSETGQDRTMELATLGIMGYIMLDFLGEEQKEHMQK